MFMKTKPTVIDKKEWYSPGAWRNGSIPSQHAHVSAAYRGQRQPLANHNAGYPRSDYATAGSVAAATFFSGFALFWVAYFAAKVIMLPTFIVNVCYLISALNTPHGMEHYNPTWLIISGLIVLFG